MWGISLLDKNNEANAHITQAYKPLPVFISNGASVRTTERLDGDLLRVRVQSHGVSPGKKGCYKCAPSASCIYAPLFGGDGLKPCNI